MSLSVVGGVAFLEVQYAIDEELADGVVGAASDVLYAVATLSGFMRNAKRVLFVPTGMLTV